MNLLLTVTFTDFLGVHLCTVPLWQARFYRRGMAGLRAKPPPGRPRKLTARQERTVLSWFRQSPRSFDFSTDLWKAWRVAQVIERKWSVVFNPRDLNAWLARRDIAPQKPQRIPGEADGEVIERWRTHDRPRLQNGRDASLFR